MFYTIILLGYPGFECWSHNILLISSEFRYTCIDEGISTSCADLHAGAIYMYIVI